VTANATPPPAREGGCLCGEVRYRVAAGAPVTDVAYCHCRMCQRAAGAPVAAWCTVPAAALAWTRGRPRAHRSSERAGRLFCPDCGSQLAFRMLDEPDRLDLAVASLDRPEEVAPEYHIWVSSRMPWFETRDELPRHRGEREG
jgi:hypothetical protein